MHSRGEGGGILGIQGLHNGVAHKNRVSACGDSRGKGLEICLFQFIQRPPICGNAHVGVRVVPVAGEMLQDTSNAVLGHAVHGAGDKFCGGVRVLAQGALIHESPGVRRDVAHGPQIHIQPQAPKKFAFLPFVVPSPLHASLIKGSPGGGKAAAAKGWVTADSCDGAAFLIHRQQQGNICCRLIAVQSGPQRVRSLVFKILGKEHKAAQMVGFCVLQGRFGIAPGEEQLANPFFDGQ